MELFHKNSSQLKAINYFHKNALSYMFDRVLNRPLIFGAALTGPFPNGFVLKPVLSNKIRSLIYIINILFYQLFVCHRSCLSFWLFIYR